MFITQIDVRYKYVRTGGSSGTMYTGQNKSSAIDSEVPNGGCVDEDSIRSEVSVVVGGGPKLEWCRRR